MHEVQETRGDSLGQEVAYCQILWSYYKDIIFTLKGMKELSV